MSDIRTRFFNGEVVPGPGNVLFSRRASEATTEPLTIEDLQEAMRKMREAPTPKWPIPGENSSDV